MKGLGTYITALATLLVLSSSLQCISMSDPNSARRWENFIVAGDDARASGDDQKAAGYYQNALHECSTIRDMQPNAIIAICRIVAVSPKDEHAKDLTDAIRRFNRLQLNQYSTVLGESLAIAIKNRFVVVQKERDLSQCQQLIDTLLSVAQRGSQSRRFWQQAQEILTMADPSLLTAAGSRQLKTLIIAAVGVARSNHIDKDCIIAMKNAAAFRASGNLLQAVNVIDGALSKCQSCRSKQLQMESIFTFATILDQAQQYNRALQLTEHGIFLARSSDDLSAQEKFIELKINIENALQSPSRIASMIDRASIKTRLYGQTYTSSSQEALNISMLLLQGNQLNDSLIWATRARNLAHAQGLKKDEDQANLHLGKIHTILNQPDKATLAYKAITSDRSAQISAHKRTAAILDKQGHLNEAIKTRTAGIALADENSPETAELYFEQSLDYTKLKNYSMVKSVALKGLAISDEVLGKTSKMSGKFHLRLAIAAFEGGDYQKAGLYANQACTIFKSEGSGDPNSYANALRVLGDIRAKTGKQQEAVSLYTQAFKLVEHQPNTSIYQKLKELLHQTHR